MASGPRFQPPALGASLLPHGLPGLLLCLLWKPARTLPPLGSLTFQRVSHAPSSGLPLNPAPAQHTLCVLLCVLSVDIIWPAVLFTCFVQDSVLSA